MTYAHEEALKALKIRALRARNLADVLDRYAKELEDTRPTPKLNVSVNTRYEWAINEIENYTRNLNFAELARHARGIA